MRRGRGLVDCPKHRFSLRQTSRHLGRTAESQHACGHRAERAVPAIVQLDETPAKPLVQGCDRCEIGDRAEALVLLYRLVGTK
jgi:hypothetical protein